jgi:hypothetical protein|tara:strand:+ start:1864 stop:2208 length:345 start_codon:yes stop_codon:yes gene_type:complete
MTNKLDKSKEVVNDLLLQNYTPVLMVKLSTPSTIRLGKNLEKFALDISKKTGYEVLMFPNEEETDLKLVSVCGDKTEEIEELREYIFTKYKSQSLENTPFTKIRDIVKKNKNEK